MAFIAFFYLPDSPEKTRFLNAEEKEAAKARAIRQVGVEGASRIGSVTFGDIGSALLDIKNWITAVTYSFDNPDMRLLILVDIIAHVFLGQRIIRLATCLPADHTPWHGIQCHKCSRA